MPKLQLGFIAILAFSFGCTGAVVDEAPPNDTFNAEEAVLSVFARDGDLSTRFGTAFLVSPDGLALSNRHVVADDSLEYSVVLNDGQELLAEVLDLDSLNDIALLQVHKASSEALPFLRFADSDQLSVGDELLALGERVKEGRITAIGQQIEASGAKGGRASLVNLLEINAMITPGDSGGPLVNLNGELVGMNTALDTQAQGVGFAIPSNELEVVLNSYKKNGRIVRPHLNLKHFLVNESVQKQYGLEVDYGAYIYEDGVDLQAGDIILELEGRKISEQFDLTNAILDFEVGDTVRLKILRQGLSEELSLVLEEAKS